MNVERASRTSNVVRQMGGNICTCVVSCVFYVCGGQSMFDAIGLVIEKFIS